MGNKGAESVREVAIGHNSSNLKKGIDRILKIDLEIAKKKADRMNVFNELDDMGYDRKEVSKIVKIKTKPVDLSFKRGVNQLCLDLGLPEEYNLTPEQIAQIEGRSDQQEKEDEDEKEVA